MVIMSILFILALSGVGVFNQLSGVFGWIIIISGFIQPIFFGLVAFILLRLKNKRDIDIKHF